jgi:hypothetical protein
MKHQIKHNGELVATIETHGDAVVVIHEPANPDYSHLIGKWVRYCLSGFESEFFFSKWVKIKSVQFLDHDMIEGSIMVNAGHQFTLHENPYLNDYEEYHESCFDLSDPRDTNPDEEERIIPFALERWRKGDYVSVQTRDGIEVMQLTEFECFDSFPLRGVYDGALGSWKKDGAYGLAERDKSRHDLMLVVKGGGQ